MSPTMREIWLLCKIPQLLLGLSCIYYHIVGIRYFIEPLFHNMVYCGVFSGFTVLTFMGIIAILQDMEVTIVAEAIYNSLAFLSYIFASLLTMSNLESDEHLVTLTDSNEELHPFFINSKMQSTVALATGISHLVSCVFAFDALIITKEQPKTKLFRYSDLVDVNPRDPIDLYFFSKRLHKYLALRSRIFREIARIPHPEDEEIMKMERKIHELRQLKRELRAVRKQKLAEIKQIRKDIKKRKKDVIKTNKINMKEQKKAEKEEKKKKSKKKPEKRLITLMENMHELNKEVEDIKREIDVEDNLNDDNYEGEENEDNEESRAASDVSLFSVSSDDNQKNNNKDNVRDSKKDNKKGKKKDDV